jgi:dynein heavy chain, axonemal
LIAQLDRSVDELLGGEELITILNESKNISEYIAHKLKTVSAAFDQLESAKRSYTLIAKRAAVLYGVLSELHKIRKMYSFSLSWFKEIFSKSLEMINIAKPEPKKE